MRLKEFQHYLADKKIDAALFFSASLLTQDPYITYFSGLEPLEVSAMIIRQSGRPVLGVPELEIERVSKQTKFKAWTLDRRTPFKALKQHVKKGSTLGISLEHLSYKSVLYLRKELHCKLVDVTSKANKLRSMKTDKEMALISRAAKITDKTFEAVVSEFGRFSHEEEVASRINSLIREFGATEAFPSIVASGSNASMPHYSGNGRLRRGFCIIDFGARYKNYCSDETRTVYIGRANKKEKEYYDLVKKTHDQAAASLSSGAQCAEVNEIARKTLGKEAKHFIHSLGHGIGVEVHEEPFLAKGQKSRLRKGNVVTIEPGIYYKKKFGIRIEDDYVVDSTRAPRLTKSPRGLICVNTKSL